MKILLLGANGQVGWELQRSLSVLGELISLGRETVSNPSGNICGDLLDLQKLSKTIRLVGPDVIVNAAAYTAVDNAEGAYGAQEAQLINADACSMLAKEAHHLGAWLVHYSTDYVFNGSGSKPWTELDEPCPLNVYGRTKLAGEREISDICPKRHLILRTSWVYGTHGNNFVKKVLSLAASLEEMAVVSDQVGAPTSAALIADVTALSVRAAFRDHLLTAGTYHCTAAGEVSWYGYAMFIIEEALKLGQELKVRHVSRKMTSEYVTAAARPLNSRLDTEKLRTKLGIHLPSWQHHLAQTLRILHQAHKSA